jgi:hypothetical protein
MLKENKILSFYDQTADDQGVMVLYQAPGSH